MSSSGKFMPLWNDFAANITNMLYDLKENKDFTDLTSRLRCTRQGSLKVPKMVFFIMLIYEV